MRFALSSYGTRGEVEPCVAIGRELLRRGHQVCMAVPSDLVDFVESAGLEPVAYKLDSEAVTQAYVDLWKHFYFSRNVWRIRDVGMLRNELGQTGLQCFWETSRTLIPLAEGANLLLTGVNFEQPAANVAEFYDIPLATMHFSPVRSNSQMFPALPPPVARSAMTGLEWLVWRLSKSLEDAQRRELGLSKTTAPYPWRMTERSLEIQAYEEACFPGLAAEWAQLRSQRPFVGTLGLELPTAADEDVASWIAAGKPPVFFGFGSMLVDSPADTLAMIAAACARLGERALVCAGGSDFGRVPDFQHVKVVDKVHYSAIFPACRALVHHGGSSTTPIGLRAGVPTLILWTIRDQAILGAAVKRLRVGAARRFSSTTEESLVEDLRMVLAPQYVTRAREIAPQMTNPAESVTAATDLVEAFARRRTVD